MLWSSDIRFFRALENAARAGLPLSRALSEGARRSGDAVQGELSKEVDEGVLLSDGMRRRRKRFPLWQAEIVAAGEASGRLDASFGLILENLEEKRSFWLSFIPKLAYPLVLIHFAPCAFNVGVLMNKGVGAFLGTVFWALLPVYAAVWVLWTAADILRSHPGIWSRLPFTRTFLREKVAHFLSLLVRAGIPLGTAVGLAARAGGMPEGYSGIRAAQNRLAGGGSFVDTLGALGLFKQEELDQLQAGEASGTIDRELRHLSDSLKERNRSVVSVLLYLLPAIIVIILGVLLGRKLVGFYMGRLDQLEDMGLL